MLDTGAPFYEVYETSDGKWMAVGGIERSSTPVARGPGAGRRRIAAGAEVAGGLAGHEGAVRRRVRTKTRDEWTAVFDGTDACVAPVLSPWEAHEHPHNVARSTYIEVDGAVQPAPAPRFTRTPSAVSKPPSPPGADTVSGLVEWGVDEGVVAKLRESGALS